MTAAITHAVWTRSKQRGAALLLLLALASYANRQGLAWPKLLTLARRARMSRRHVRSLLQVLAAGGEIEIEPYPSDRRRRRYRLVAFVDEAATSRSDSRPQPRKPSQQSNRPRQREHRNSPAPKPRPRGRMSYLDRAQAEWAAITRRAEPEPFRLNERLQVLAELLPVELPERSRWQQQVLGLLSGEMEEVEAELARIEQRLLDELEARLPSSQRAELRAEVEKALAPLRRRITPEKFRREVAASYKTRLSEHFDLPHFSLFGPEVEEVVES